MDLYEDGVVFFDIMAFPDKEQDTLRVVVKEEYYMEEEEEQEEIAPIIPSKLTTEILNSLI